MSGEWFNPNQGVMPPELLAQLMGQRTLEEQDEDLRNQIEMAQQLRGQQSPERYGAKAGALQLMADIVRGVKGKGMEEKARAEQVALRGQREAGLKGIGEWYMQNQGQNGQPPLKDPYAGQMPSPWAPPAFGG